MLEQQHRVGVLERGPEHAARVLDGRRRDHLDPGDVRVPALQAVRVLRRELPAGAGGHPDHQRHVQLAAGHVREGRGVVEDLVEREQAEVHGHDLDDRPQPGERGADARADEAGLRERGVADPLGTELLEQPEADGEAAAVHPDVLAHQEDPVVLAQRLPERLAQRLPVRRLDGPGGSRHRGGPRAERGHLTPPSPCTRTARGPRPAPAAPPRPPPPPGPPRR